eukprot:scaffold4004_cov105-Cylindrotheca_fusiformis.AAC.4
MEFKRRMHGMLPTEIGNFKRLEKLSIVRNQQLVGTIPSEIGNMRQLSYLEPSYNAFLGTLPTEIGNMQQLTALWLIANMFLGPIASEMGNLHQLVEHCISTTRNIHNDGDFAGTKKRIKQKKMHCTKREICTMIRDFDCTTTTKKQVNRTEEKCTTIGTVASSPYPKYENRMCAKRYYYSIKNSPTVR